MDYYVLIWLRMPVTPSLGRVRQKDLELQISLGYI
jgi:hypothetical protein